MSSQDNAPPLTPPESASPSLGRLSLWLGLGALVCGAVAGLGWIVPVLTGVLSWLAVLVGIAAIVVGIIAIVKRQDRKLAIIGLALVVATGPVAFVMAFITTMISLISYYGISG